jgi:16S rRNA (guanine527-N7)-methyltransferase
LPLLRVGGTFLAYKTISPKETENAQNAIQLLGGQLREIKTYTLPGTDISRALVVVDKIAPTPARYPRGKNKERADPL